MLSSADFVPVTFANKAVLDRYLAQYPQAHSEYSPVTILSWADHYPCSFAEYEGHLILECVHDGFRQIYAPIGPADADAIDAAYAYARSVGAAFSFFDEETRALFAARHPDVEIEEVRGYFEYCWYTQTLAELKGKPFVGIRGQINRFLREYAYTVEPVTAENMPEVRDLIVQWAAEKAADDGSMMHDEVAAVSVSLDHFADLRLEGILLRIGGTAVAVAIWENMPADVVLIHYEKGLREFPGIYKIINWETAKYLQNRYKIINRESDVDDPGLREAKMRYHPDLFIRAYIVTA